MTTATTHRCRGHGAGGGGAGLDRVYTALAGYTITANVERLYGQSSAGQSLGGNSLNNLISAGSGNDWLGGQGGNDTLNGNDGNDILDGGSGNDTMAGGMGDDIYFVDSASDLISEASGAGIDRVSTALAVYTLGANFERLYGNAATGQVLNGNDLDNMILGSTGNDTLNGGLGADRLNGGGGAGSDSFVFDTALGVNNIDTIENYSPADDTIRLDATIFTGLAHGPLSAEAFFAGAAAHDADDRIIYNGATGAVMFDADGNGSMAAIQFATLSTPAFLTAADFFVI